jgi:hypothetical protein
VLFRSQHIEADRRLNRNSCLGQNNLEVGDPRRLLVYRIPIAIWINAEEKRKGKCGK